VTYIEPDLQDDEGAVAEANLAALADITGFVPSEASIETLFAEALAIGQATANAIIKDEARNAFAGMGELVLGVERGVAAPARTQATITVTDALGHLIPAGYQVVMLTADGDSVTLASTTDATVIAGATTVAGVLFEALEPGVEGNGAAGAAIDRDPLAFVANVVLEQPSSGGVDEEELIVYVSRVARAARRRSFLPLTPSDYAGAAQDVTGVSRALALNRVNPDVAGDQPGHITIKPVTATGDPVPAVVKTALSQAFAAQEQVLGAVVWVADAVIVTINVAVTVVREPAFAAADVTTQVTAAIRALLNKATWNADAREAGGWRKGVGTVTTYDVSAAIDDLQSIRQVVTVTLNAGTAAVTVAADALANAGTVAVTVQ